jgi:hypothetical protein
MKLVEEFTKRNLTKDLDTLPALSGIAATHPGGADVYFVVQM